MSKKKSDEQSDYTAALIGAALGTPIIGVAGMEWGRPYINVQKKKIAEELKDILSGIKKEAETERNKPKKERTVNESVGHTRKSTKKSLVDPFELNYSKNFEKEARAAVDAAERKLGRTKNKVLAGSGLFGAILGGLIGDEVDKGQYGNALANIGTTAGATIPPYLIRKGHLHADMNGRFKGMKLEDLLFNSTIGGGAAGLGLGKLAEVYGNPLGDNA